MIETHELTKDFKDFRAVDHISFSVEPGMIFAILGPNGAGKTTTVRMLTSILKPTIGWARVAGYDVVKQATAVRTSVGVLTEQHGLYERMKGIEYLDFFARIYRLPTDLRKTRPLHRRPDFRPGKKSRLGLCAQGNTRACMHRLDVLWRHHFF